MHYCALLITKRLPSEEDIKRIMSPYDERNFEYNEDGSMINERPIFQCDYYMIGGRYNGQLKLKIDRDDDKYEWRFAAIKPRNGRLFWSYLLNFIKENTTYPFVNEEDYYGSMGARDDFLYVDGGHIKDLLNFVDVQCYICIDAVNDNVIARETFDGDKFVLDENFDKKLDEIKKNSMDYFATVLDIHD